MVVGGWLYDQITTCRLKKTGRNPADRGKQGVKRSLMTDANGLPLWQVVAGANTHDIKLVEYTLDAAYWNYKRQDSSFLSMEASVNPSHRRLRFKKWEAPPDRAGSSHCHFIF